MATARLSTLNVQNVDSRFKLLVIGDTDVGKTCLLFRLANDEFQQNNMNTIGK